MLLDVGFFYFGYTNGLLAEFWIICDVVQGFRLTGVLFNIDVGLLLVTFGFFAKGKQSKVSVDYIEALAMHYKVFRDFSLSVW